METVQRTGRRAFLLALLLVTARPGQGLAQPVEAELANVRAYCAGKPARTARAQLLLSSLGFYHGPADGRWGGATEKAMRNALVQYIAIGGSGEDWGVNRPGDTRRFLDWMEQAANANATGTDYPD